MGKQKHAKRHHTSSTPPLFPFHLLQWWFKPITSDEICIVCNQEPVTFVSESYLDMPEYVRLLVSGRDVHDVTNIVWAKSVSEQTTGHYTNYLSSYLCRDCAYKAIETAVGSKAASIAVMPTMYMRLPGSIAVGSRLQTPQDDGINFAVCFPARVQTIDDVAAMMRKETVGIKLD